MTLSGNDGDGERWCNPESNCHAWEKSVFTKRAGPAGMACEKRRSAGRAAKEGAIRQAVVLTGDLRAQPASLGGRVMVETGEC